MNEHNEYLRLLRVRDVLRARVGRLRRDGPLGDTSLDLFVEVESKIEMRNHRLKAAEPERGKRS
jgi:hypothetical protein